MDAVYVLSAAYWILILVWICDTWGQCINYLNLWWRARQWMTSAGRAIASLDTLEQVPLPWPIDNTTRTTYRLAMAEAAEALSLCGKPLSLAFPAVASMRSRLEWRLIAASYRLGESVENAEPLPDLLRALTTLAEGWLHVHPLHDHAHLDACAQAQVAVAACHPPFAALVLSCPSLRETFFTWVLQDSNTAAPFIAYPYWQETLTQSQLAGRLHYAGDDSLQIRRMPTAHHAYAQVLTLRLGRKMVPLNDPAATFTFSGGLQLKTSALLDLFRKKFCDAGTIEFLQQGLTNWHAYKLAHWDAATDTYCPIDLKDPGWWRQLPLLEVLDRHAARRRYGIALDGKHWAAAATATRGSPTLDYAASHAFLEVAIPLDDGRYAIYPFGKSAIDLPKNAFETLKIFCHSVHAGIVYPDENVYYTHRQHARHSFALTARQGQQLMDLVRRDIAKGWEGNLIYQIESENCAKWVHTLLEEIIGSDAIPNMFVMPLLDAEPQGPVAAAFSLIKKLPSQSLQTRILTALHYPLGAWRGNWICEGSRRVWKALNSHPFWYSGLVYLPAFLHHQRHSGTLSQAYGGLPGALLRPRHLNYFPPADTLSSHTVVRWPKNRASLWNSSSPPPTPTSPQSLNAMAASPSSPMPLPTTPLPSSWPPWSRASSALPWLYRCSLSPPPTSSDLSISVSDATTIFFGLNLSPKHAMLPLANTTNIVPPLPWLALPSAMYGPSSVSSELFPWVSSQALTTKLNSVCCEHLFFSPDLLPRRQSSRQCSRDSDTRQGLSLRQAEADLAA